MRLLTIGAMQQGRMASIDVDLQIYLASLTTPLSSPQIALLNTFVKDLKTGLGITRLYDAFDLMLIHANETIESGLNNLVKRSHDATLSATAPAFTVLEGFEGDGSSAFIDSNYNPTNSAINVTMSNASAGTYVRKAGILDAGARAYFGSNESTNRVWYIPRRTSGNRYTLLFHNAVVNTLNYDEGSVGMHILNKIEDQTKLWINNVNTFTHNSSAGVVSNANIREFVAAGASASTHQSSLFYMSKNLTESQIGILTNTFQAYMTANGKQV